MRKLFILLFIMSFLGCEKDDICSDETTPKLVIEFYDISNPTNLKNVVSLKVTAIGQTEALNTFSGVNKISIPLKITDTTTKYSLILNSSDAVNRNEDFVEFNYSKENVYVSRACGYKTIFELNNSVNGVLHTDASDGFWMQNIVKVTNSITNENETHLKIYF
jgi:hypothetical protein